MCLFVMPACVKVQKGLFLPASRLFFPQQSRRGFQSEQCQPSHLFQRNLFCSIDFSLKKINLIWGNHKVLLLPVKFKVWSILGLCQYYLVLQRQGFLNNTCRELCRFDLVRLHSVKLAGRHVCLGLQEMPDRNTVRIQAIPVRI